MLEEEYEKKHAENVQKYSLEVSRLYDDLVIQAGLIGTSVSGFNPDKPFEFSKYPALKARIDKLLKQFYDKLNVSIVNGIEAEWTLANNKNNELSRRVFGDNVNNIPKDVERRYFSNSLSALDAFKKRKVNGLDLSQRVWNYTGQLKQEMEMAIDLGLRSGQSANDMARDLKQYLRNPDKLFRRVRDEHGNLHLSKRAKAYNPGQGVYRSSYKNARRLAATETNIAYRTADYERTLQRDDVLGIEVKLSNNHTLNGVPFTDICDDLAGTYPKDFKFVGWHPQCRCYTTKILVNEDDFADLINNGANNPIEPKGKIKDVPDNFKNWIENNKERSRGWNSLPLFIKENKQFAPQMFNAKKYTAFEKKFMRHSSTHLAVERMSSYHYQTKYSNLTSIELGAIHHYTRSNTMAYRALNKQLAKGKTDPFNRAFGGLVSSGLKKLPDYKGIVYRGSILTKTQLASYFDAHSRGASLSHKFFTSGSKKPEIADTFQNLRRLRREETKCAFVIKSKRGKYVDDISEFNGKFARTKQQEVIFDKDAKFDVISITEGESNTLKILLEEI